LRAFVTGATGFAGGHLCRALVSRRWEVKGLSRKTSDTSTLRSLGVEVVTGDIREKSSFASAVRGVDAVFHLAAVFREAGLPEQVYEDVNVGGTRSAIEAAAEAGVRRFVHCSTVGVHGDTGAKPADETRPIVPSDDSYSRTKIAGERVARELFEKLSLRGTILRPTAGYGPGEMRYLKLFKGIRQGRFVMIGSGATLHNLVFTDDLCEGIILAGERPEAAGETFLIGSEENVRLDDLVAKIARVVRNDGSGVKLRVPAWPVMGAAIVCESLCRPLGIEPPLHRRRVGFFTVNRAVDVSKARRILGYRSTVSLDEGLRRTAAWYESKGLL
jgi:nucleoside-diphosphate-sugar epimerase